MRITIADILHFQYFAGMKLIAGEGGLDNTITKCGILDYEYDSSLKNKYTYTNFQEGQFVLTSFLYAKDNEFLIIDALKHLITKKISGLAIKNVFRIPLSETLLRYADSKKIPIFLIEDPTLYFEDIIVNVSECIHKLSSIDFGETEADMMMNGSLDDLALTQRALHMNHSLRPNLLGIYFRPKKVFSVAYYIELIDRYRNSPLYSTSDSLFQYRGGLMLIHSCDTFNSDNIEDLVSDYIRSIPENPMDFFIGISDLHHRLSDLKNALWESLYASIMHRSDKETYQLYKDIGVYGILLPFVEDPRLRIFSSQIIEPLLDYDTENKTKLTETALQFVSCDGNIHKLAQMLLQHENTIRYRLDKIRNVTGLDVRKPEQYERLSIAVKIHISRNLLQEFSRGISMSKI